MQSIRDAALALSPAERFQLLEDIWESLADDPSSIPVPQWQIEELERRREEHLKNPETGCSWDEAVRYARDRHAR